MKHTFGEKLPCGYYMLWGIDNKTDTSESIVAYFTSKYGYIPDEVIIGDKVEVGFPSSSKGAKFMVPDFHIKMR